jgi:hypothetical protein
MIVESGSLKAFCMWKAGETALCKPLVLGFNSLWLTLVQDLPYQSLPHGLSDRYELFSVTLGEREKGLVVLLGPFPRMTTAATTAGSATPAPPAGLLCMYHMHSNCGVHVCTTTASAVGHRDNSLWPGTHSATFLPALPHQ